MGKNNVMHTEQISTHKYYNLEDIIGMSYKC